MRLALSPLLLAACAEPAIVFELPRDDEARAFVLLVERAGALVETVAFDADARDRPAPSPLTDVTDEERVVYTLAAFGERLDPLGIVPGAFAAGAAPATRALGRFRGRGALREARVEAGVRSDWGPIEELPASVAALPVPAVQGCRRFTPEPLHPLEDDAGFLIAVGDRHLIGTEDHRLIPIPPIGTSTDVTPRDAAMLAGAEHFPTWGAWPIADRPDQFWLSGRDGALWKVRFDARGRPVEVLERHDTGLDEGLRWFAGESTSARVDLAFVGLDGTVGRFDGHTFEILYKYQLPADHFYIGGMGRDADGAFVGGYSQSNELAIIRPSGRFSLEPLGTRGIATIGFVEGIGLLVSDVQGRIYVRKDGVFEDFGDAQIANGAEAIVPVPGGFILSGSAGAIREWRPNGGFCDPVERLVLQTLRFWSPIEGGYLVTGTDPNAGDGTAPVTIFHVEE